MAQNLQRLQKRHRTVASERVRRIRLDVHRRRVDRRLEVVGEVMRDVADDLQGVAERIHGVAGGLFYRIDGSIVLIDSSDIPLVRHPSDADIKRANKVSLIGYDEITDVLHPIIIKNELTDFSGTWLFEGRREIIRRTARMDGLILDAVGIEDHLPFVATA